MRSKSRHLAIAAGVGSFALCNSVSKATQLAYEDWSTYPVPTSLYGGGANGGTGWSGGWVAGYGTQGYLNEVRSGAVAYSGQLTDSSINHASFSAQDGLNLYSGGPQLNYVARPLATQFGTAGSTVWGSVVYAYAGGDSSNLYNGGDFALQLALQESGVANRAIYDLPYENGANSLVLFQVNYSAANTGTVSYYVDPTLPFNATTATPTYTTPSQTLDFNQLELNITAPSGTAYQGANLGAIRFGTTAADVTAVATGPVAATWKTNATGDWNSASNWTTAVPNGVGAEADFLNAFTSNHLVYTESAITAGKIVFNNSSASYTITGAAGTSLTLQTSSGSAVVDVTAGTHELNIPLIVASNTTFQTDSSAAQLIVANPVTVNAGVSLNSSGSGTVVYQSNVTIGAGGSFALASPTFAHALALQSNATATVATGATVHANLLQLSSLSLAAGSSLDLSNNELILHGGDIGSITSAVGNGYNGGNWNGAGIVSQTAANDATHLTTLGVKQINSAGTFDGAAVASGDVVVKYTYYGDASLNGQVDSTDYTQIDNGFLSKLSGWSNGDFNYDGAINGSDYTLIDNAFNTQGAQLNSEIASATAQIAGSGATSAVPEPTSLGLLGLGAVGLLGRRRLK
jgi:hypothetical protein